MKRADYIDPEFLFLYLIWFERWRRGENRLVLGGKQMDRVGPDPDRSLAPARNRRSSFRQQSDYARLNQKSDCNRKSARRKESKPLLFPQVGHMIRLCSCQDPPPLSSTILAVGFFIILIWYSSVCHLVDSARQHRSRSFLFRLKNKNTIQV